MYSRTIHCWKSNGVFSSLHILHRQSIFYSTYPTTTTTTRGSISIFSESNSLSSLTNWLVHSLGFSEKQALSTSSKLAKRRQYNGAKQVFPPTLLNQADCVINFLQQKGFQIPHIRNIVYYVPQILISKIEHTLKPKIMFFQELGLSVSDLARVIPNQPQLMFEGLDSTIRPVVEDLRAIMGNDEDVVRVIKGFRFEMLRLVPKHLVCNVNMLRALGIPIEAIRKRILNLPSPFMRKPEFFKEIVAQAQTKWGFSVHSPMFLDAVHVLGCLSEETIESKCRVFESFGWERADVEGLFRRRPFCLGLSEANLKEKLGFLMDKLGYEPGYMVKRSAMLTYSLGKRLVPRHLVFQVLKEKGLIQGDLDLCRVMNMSDSVFLERYVRLFESEIPELLQIYTTSVTSSSPRQYKRRTNSGWYQNSEPTKD